MTNLQKLTIRASEIRSRLNEIAGLATDAVTDAIRTESDKLAAEYPDTERQLRAATIAGDGERAVTTDDSEARERRALCVKSGVFAWVKSAVSGRPIEGRERELSDAYKQNGLMPLALFDLDRPAAPVEDRAVTPGVQAIEVARPTVPYVFERSVSAMLGVTFPGVAAGAANFPVVTTKVPADTLAKDAAAPDTAAAFTLTTRTPKRVSGSFEVRREDMAVQPDIESSLRMAIGGSLRDELDDQVIGGAGSGGDLNGLFNQASDVSAASAVESFATGVARFAGLVDGQYANGWGNLRAIVGSSTFALYAGLFQGSTALSLYDYLEMKLAGITVSNRVPVVASMAQKVLVTRMAQAEYAIQVPQWGGVEIIRDPYTNAKKGQVVLTAIMLVGDPHVPHGTNQVVELHPKLS